VERPTEPIGGPPGPRRRPPAEAPEIGGVAITRRFFVIAIVAVCVLSAAIGSAISLIAQTGPAGPPGERGPAGPRGPRGEVDTGAIEDELEALRSETDPAGLEEALAEDEERIEELEDGLRGAERTTSELCGTLELVC
jgi:hypothetical protein